MSGSARALTIGLHCTKCGRPVTVEYIPDPEASVTAGPAAAPIWLCPHYHCDARNWLGGVRKIVTAWRGHGPKGQSWPTPPEGLARPYLH